MLFLLIIMQMCDLWVAIFKLCLPTLHTDFYGAASFVSVIVRFMISRNDAKLNKNLFFFLWRSLIKDDDYKKPERCTYFFVY